MSKGFRHVKGIRACCYMWRVTELVRKDSYLNITVGLLAAFLVSFCLKLKKNILFLVTSLLCVCGHLLVIGSMVYEGSARLKLLTESQRVL